MPEDEAERAKVRNRFLGRALAALAPGDLEAAWGRPGVYAASKRQLSHRELTRRGLRNEAKEKE